ncbi:obg-like ATPase 1 isoform X2 [Erythrolamprus reginae]|uniref:obg-like ATPase 1 isoform X2 n=2 Tax=Erythrolamprus reginae TaxID=121349 RepID=UPI00396CC1E8
MARPPGGLDLRSCAGCVWGEFRGKSQPPHHTYTRPLPPGCSLLLRAGPRAPLSNPRDLSPPPVSAPEGKRVPPVPPAAFARVQSREPEPSKREKAWPRGRDASASPAVSRAWWGAPSPRLPGSKMPPKKGGDGIKPHPIIGRFGTSLKIGIVGLPNVGKSTFFNVLTKSQAAAENFPFCTIDPNESRVPVPDDRYEFLCQYHKPPSKIPAFLNVVDIAGLVKGAHAGQGLGNAFLSHISACDGIFHLLRSFDDDDITHIEGSVEPVRDIEIIHEELRLKDEEMIMPIIDKLEKVAVRGGDKKLKPEYDIMCKIKSWVIDEKKPIRFYHDWNDKEIEVLNKYLFLTSKPMMYLINLSEKDYIRKKNKWLIKIKEWVDKQDPGALVIPFSGALELKLQEMSAEEKQKYLEENMTQSALPKIIKAGYAALQLEYFFTAGPDEVRAWTIRKGTKAPQAAGKIHTDFEKGFIMAEVMKFEDFKEGGSEVAVKAAGKYRQQGRNYVVEDGDIIFFKFNTPQQPKKK